MKSTRIRPGEKVALWGPADAPVIERTESAKIDPNCGRCDLGARFPEGSRCIKPVIRQAEGPALLVIAPPPVLYSHEKNAGFLGPVWRETRSRIEDVWPGTVVFDHALKCAAGDVKPSPAMFAACRPYLARSFEFYDYDRVLLLGRAATMGFLGRSIDVESLDFAFAWSDVIDAPVGIVQSPMEVARNRPMLDALFRRIETFITGARPKRPPIKTARAVRVHAQIVDQLEAWAEGAEELALDIETEGRVYDPDFRILCLSIARESSDLVWLWDAADLRIGGPTAEALTELLTTRRVVAQNITFEVQGLLKSLGIVFPSTFCTLNAFKLHNPGARAGLDTLQELVGAGGAKGEMKAALKPARAEVVADAAEAIKLGTKEIEGRKAEAKRSHAINAPDAYAYGKVEQRLLLKYNARDTLTTAWVRGWMRDKTEPRVERLWFDYIEKLQKTCTYMERTGLLCDRPYARKLQGILTDKLASTQIEATEMLRADGFKGTANLESPQQLAEVLYGHYGFEPPWTTDAGAPSTDKFALKKLAGMAHPGANFAGLVLSRRRFATLAKTYAWSFDRFVQGDGRIHPVLKPYGTETGRLSGSDPNPQNLPRGDDAEGKMVKNLIIAPKGRLLAVFDHATLEIRVAAALSQDPLMLSLLSSGVDFHLATARIISGIFKVDPDTLTKDHWLRGAAKTLYFALLYGKGDASAAEDLNVAVEIAQGVRNAILGANKGLAAWIAQTEKQAVNDRGVWIRRPGVEFSRFRPLPWATSSGGGERAKAMRQAVNTKVQGFGADINNSGMIACHEWIQQGTRSRHIAMPLAVHDSLVFEFDAGALDEVLETVPRLMTGFDVGAPLVIDAAVGERFGDVKRVDLKV